jgi:HSP20 family protein
MEIKRYQSLGDFALLGDSMNYRINDTYFEDEAVSQNAWIPPVDIYENDQNDLVLKAELPDIARNDIHVSVKSDTLTLRGEKKFANDAGEDKFRRVERRYGSFSRSFTLPSTVDGGKVKADYKDGVLTVHLPFREEAKPRTIDVEVTS